LTSNPKKAFAWGLTDEHCIQCRFIFTVIALVVIIEALALCTEEKHFRKDADLRVWPTGRLMQLWVNRRDGGQRLFGAAAGIKLTNCLA